jgi:AcrR family transcriptional regulator
MESGTAMAKQAERKADRLDAHAWIEAALDATAKGGVGTVRVEPLAAALKVTKGSFYWHFVDRQALIDAMLAHWAEGRIAAIRQHATSTEAPAATLRKLADLYIHHANWRGLAIELAIRAFAHGNAGARKAVRTVDKERLKDVKALFAALGWPSQEAQARAVLFYSYLFGRSLLDVNAVTPQASAIAIEALLQPAR